MGITNKCKCLKVNIKTTSISIGGVKPVMSGKGVEGGPVRKQKAEKTPLLGISTVYHIYVCYSHVSRRNSFKLDYVVSPAKGFAFSTRGQSG